MAKQIAGIVVVVLMCALAWWYMNSNDNWHTVTFQGDNIFSSARSGLQGIVAYLCES